MEVFKDYAYYYNAFYQDKDYVAESKQVDNLLRRYGSNIRKIVNYGCGTGKHDIELSRLGYHCVGIDMSPLMINIAKENSKDAKVNIDFFVSDIREYKPTQVFDAVISLFHVMSYQNSNDDILAAFQTARKALKKGGVFLFDAWYGPGVLNDKPMVRVKEIETEKHKLIRVARPVMHDTTNVVDVCYNILIIDKESNEARTINETHHMRYFFRPELEFYLKVAGFKLVDSLDCITLGETSYESWTSYFVAKAV